MTLHLIDVALLVASALDEVGITHSIGGATSDLLERLLTEV